MLALRPSYARTHKDDADLVKLKHAYADLTNGPKWLGLEPECLREIGKFLIQFFSTLLLLQKPRNCVCAACAWVFQQLAAEKRRKEKMDVALFSPSSLFAEEDDVTVGTHFLFYISSISFYFACRKMNIVFVFVFFFNFQMKKQWRLVMATSRGRTSFLKW